MSLLSGLFRQNPAKDHRKLLLSDAHTAEHEAKERLDDAAMAAWDELTEQQVGGRDLLSQIDQRTREARQKYDQARFERLVLERDERMLNRGTRRGVLFTIGVGCLVATFLLARENEPILWYLASLSFLIALWALSDARRLKRIPRLDDETD